MEKPIWTQIPTAEAIEEIITRGRGYEENVVNDVSRIEIDDLYEMRSSLFYADVVDENPEAMKLGADWTGINGEKARLEAQKLFEEYFGVQVVKYSVKVVVYDASDQEDSNEDFVLTKPPMTYEPGLTDDITSEENLERLLSTLGKDSEKEWI